ncbi:hypothetical protein FQN49_003702 [Arthroderma sp. PD_2]|nr:hypothetical protein FQN49_003702 [Arthroderma sp. PD_2]
MNKNGRKRIGLLPFLKNAAQCSRAPASATKPQPTYVLGNSSADLDSIISAIIYSYFATPAKSQEGRQYVPVINLPDVPAGRELRRLRPEFTAALNLATQRPWNKVQPRSTVGLNTLPEDDNTDDLLKDSILTVADLRGYVLNKIKLGDQAFSENSQLGLNLSIFMVDWNVLPTIPPYRIGIDGISNRVEDVNVSVVGCIDHHEDEGFISKHSMSKSGTESEPQCIQTGVGSCTSIIVRELRNRGWWNDCNSSTIDGTLDDTAVIGERSNLDTQDAVYESQAAQLALAAILADTANMTNESKVSDVDRETVTFLENKISQCTSINWDRDAFYSHIMDAKTSSVDFLTVDETLGRDYKEWVDPVRPGHNIKIGICSVVKPISWLFEKCGSEISQRGCNEAFSETLDSFSKSRGLDIVAIMTAFSSPLENEFQRELVVDIQNDEYSSKLDDFKNAATDDLGLKDWLLNGEEIQDLGAIRGKTRIWRQCDVTKSRKQVAPLVRKIFTGGI